MKRAVHRLEPKLRLFKRGRREHRVGIVLLMSTYLPQFALGDVWRINKTIVAPHQFLAQVVFHLLTDDSALRMPEDQSLPVLFLNRKQVEFFAKTSVISLLGLFALLEPCV